MGRLLDVLEEDVAPVLVLHLQEMLGALALLHLIPEEVVHTLQSPIVTVEIEAQGEIGVGGPQMQGV